MKDARPPLTMGRINAASLKQFDDAKRQREMRRAIIDSARITAAAKWEEAARLMLGGSVDAALRMASEAAQHAIQFQTFKQDAP